MGVSSSWYICRTISAVSSLLWLFMSHNTSIARLRANSLAKSRPRPLPAPVITHTCPATLFSLGRTTHFAPAVTKAQSTLRMTTKNSAIIIIILTDQFERAAEEEAARGMRPSLATCSQQIGGLAPTKLGAQRRQETQSALSWKCRRGRKIAQAGAQLVIKESSDAAQSESGCRHSCSKSRAATTDCASYFLCRSSTHFNLAPISLAIYSVHPSALDPIGLRLERLSE